MLRRLSVMLLLLILPSASLATEWRFPDGTLWEWGIIYSASFHGPHTLYSDGKRNAEEARDVVRMSGSQVFIVCDHVDQIDKKKKYSDKLGCAGFDNYLQDFSGGDPIGIAGCELTFGKSHLLVFGERDQMKAFMVADRGKSQQEAINKAKELGLLTVAAHPFSKTYPFDFSQAEGLNGMELYNESHASYVKTRAQYLKFMAEGKDIFLEAGVDSHTALEPDDKERWKRKTWLNAAPTVPIILLNFRLGITFVSCGGVSLQKNYFPSPDFRWRSEVTGSGYWCKLTFLFRDKLAAAKKVRIYRNGVAIAMSERTIPKGSKIYTYDYQDKPAPAGKCIYNIEIEDLFFTSGERYDFRPGEEKHIDLTH